MLICGFVALVLLGGLILWSSPSREPSYQGKSLSEWIAPFCRQMTNGAVFAPAGPLYYKELQPVRRAVSAIGTNALPILVAKLKHPESAPHRFVRRLAGKVHLNALMLEEPRAEQIRAIRALAILGPAAQSAAPDLAAQLSDPVIEQHAVYALEAMGDSGMRVLADQLTNSNYSVRMRIAMTFISGGQPTPWLAAVGHNPAEALSSDVRVHALERIIEDPGFRTMRYIAIDRLAALGPGASNSASFLLSLLDDSDLVARSSAIRALGRIKAEPDLVIPALTDLLNSPDLLVQMAALNALHEYGYPAQLPLPHPGGFPQYPFNPGPAFTNSSNFGPGIPRRARRPIDETP